MKGLQEESSSKKPKMNNHSNATINVKEVDDLHEMDDDEDEDEAIAGAG